ncbi:unnamed protein product [Peronospora belbahrii]|uniref:Uncharacterized protein n=1 Tax=Peronospora belbahrii TaxID=622444 RepID=A0AAU9LD72_9STRA|nr:unnamed protein product [Peronospora belbahrii]
MKSSVISEFLSPLPSKWAMNNVMIPKARMSSCVYHDKFKPSTSSNHCITLLNATINPQANDKDIYHAVTSEDKVHIQSDDTLSLVDALPRDRESLEYELDQLNELERQVENEIAVDLKLGCDLLIKTREEQITKAWATLERRRVAARKVFDYASEKAQEMYDQQCTELKRDMNTDMERELRRLQTAKDGVSVTSRRRRAVRDETRKGCAIPAKRAGNNMRRRRTMYTASGGDEDGPEDVFLASASPEERAQREQFHEKKRLEQLLSCTSVFKPVVEQVTAKEIAKDLKTIQSAVLCYNKHLKTRKIKMEKKKDKAKLEQKQKHHVKKKHHKEKKLKRQRPMIVTPRRIPYAGSNVPAPTTMPEKATSTAKKNRRPRLLYNPRMLQEGQEVEVFFRRQRIETAADDADESQDDCVMSGIITAATATQVYLLTASGRFESFDVRDCILGSLYVRAVESTNSPKSCARKRYEHQQCVE